MNTELTPLFIDGFLTEQNQHAIKELTEELNDAWAKRQVFRTETEMRVSVLNDSSFPTPASKYWQAVREQTVMLDNLTMLGFEYRRNEIMLKRKQESIKVAEGLDADEIQVDIDECLFKQASMRQVAQDRIREILLWSQLKKELADGSFDTADVNTHQLKSIIAQLQEREKNLTQGCSQAEVLNVFGPLVTAIKLQAQILSGNESLPNRNGKKFLRY